jgi:RHS repeat-associated protein
VGQIAFTNSSAWRMTTAKQYDYLNRLAAISSAPSAASALSYSYQYNSASQRVRTTLADGSSWLYTYDPLGQVIAGDKYWADQTPVAGQQFEYGFDNIGNRTFANAGGDQNGENLRSASYTANNLNQYTQRTVPGYLDIMGLGFATNAVTVNGQTASRKVEYFREQLSVANGSAPVWQPITNSETGQTTVTGNLFVAKSPEVFAYDGDGNLTNDGRWAYTWDAENRLVRMTNNTAVGPQQLITFVYDWKGRRIQKQVSANGTMTNNVTFVYEGWNPIAKLNATNSNVVQSYVWGLDLSGSMQGAGGVGGLLEVGDAVNGVHFAAYDGNGNIAGLVKAADGTSSAVYEYGPFGEVIRATGPMAKANPLRFSTKSQDDETDLLYYGYRYYNASTGRWISRDLKAEAGELNLYGFATNDGIDRYDYLGMLTLNQVESYIAKRRKHIHDLNIMCRCDCGKRQAQHKYSIAGHSQSSQDGAGVYASTSWRDCKGSECCGPFNSTYLWWDCYSSAQEGGKTGGDLNYGWSFGGPEYSKQANPKWYSTVAYYLGWDPYHIDVYSRVVYEQCVNGRLQTQDNLSLNSLLWKWSTLWQDWFGPKVLGPGEW